MDPQDFIGMAVGASFVGAVIVLRLMDKKADAEVREIVKEDRREAASFSEKVGPVWLDVSQEEYERMRESFSSGDNVEFRNRYAFIHEMRTDCRSHYCAKIEYVEDTNMAKPNYEIIKDAILRADAKTRTNLDAFSNAQLASPDSLRDIAVQAIAEEVSEALSKTPAWAEEAPEAIRLRKAQMEFNKAMAECQTAGYKVECSLERGPNTIMNEGFQEIKLSILRPVIIAGYR